MIQKLKLSQLLSNEGQIGGLPKNPRFIKDDRFKALVKSLQDDPEMLEIRELLVYPFGKKYVIIGGNMRFRAASELGITELPCKVLDAETPVSKLRAYTIKDNVAFGQNDFDILANEWDEAELLDFGMEVWDTQPGEEEESQATEKEADEPHKKLSDRFIIPPFSVLDTKQGTWSQRKNYWLSIGIKSEEGRDAECLPTSINGEKYKGFDMLSATSIFDPVLCELAYQWFNIPKGNILDPFAGGSVRGIVAAKLGFNYLGNDLRKEQIDANRINAKEVLQNNETLPIWTCGDSLRIDEIAKDYKADMIFSCPPYADLEVYSDAKEDISNMPYHEFIKVYNEIIRKSCEILQEDRFAVFVVGDIRDKKGFYQNFVSDTINAFVACNVLLYNEMILVNMVGTLAIRAGKQFSAGRKVGKQHQNVLVFYKGNPKNIRANYPELDLSYMDEQVTE